MKANVIRFVIMFSIGGLIYISPRFFKKTEKTIATEQTTSNTKLIAIRDQIYIIQETKNVEKLKVILEDLKKIRSHESDYWQAYVNYQMALKSFESNPNDSKVYTEEANKIIDEMPAKNSEDFALKSMINGFSIQFASFYEVASIANDAKNNANQAIKLDSTNLRAYLALGINDFYTPEMFGGMKQSEKLFKRAVELAYLSDKHPINWGKSTAQDFLNKYYQKISKAN